MAKYKTVALLPDAFDQLETLTGHTGLKKGIQVAMLVKNEITRIVSVESLPCPDGATPVPLVIVAPFKTEKKEG